MMIEEKIIKAQRKFNSEYEFITKVKISNKYYRNIKK